jgi:TBC1 domain family member 8/9
MSQPNVHPLTFDLTHARTRNQVVQLTALRPSADLFCALLRDALKAELQRGQMKAVKAFVRTCYSEALLATTSNVAATEREDGSLIKADEPGGEAVTAEGPAYLGGLGLRFKFPGDPKK